VCRWSWSILPTLFGGRKRNFTVDSSSWAVFVSNFPSRNFTIHSPGRVRARRTNRVREDGKPGAFRISRIGCEPFRLEEHAGACVRLRRVAPIDMPVGQGGGRPCPVPRYRPTMPRLGEFGAQRRIGPGLTMRAANVVGRINAEFRPPVPIPTPHCAGNRRNDIPVSRA